MNNSEKMSAVIKDYIEASNLKDSKKVVSLFTANAIVEEKGKIYSGTNEITEWQSKALFINGFHIEVLNVNTDNSETVLTVDFSGDFPGTNPVVIIQRFTLNGEKIQRLVLN